MGHDRGDKKQRTALSLCVRSQELVEWRRLEAPKGIGLGRADSNGPYLKRRPKMTSYLKTAIISIPILLAAGLSPVLRPATNTAPGVLQLGDVKVRIVGLTFVSRLDGTNLRYEETEPNKYRGLVMTLEVTKPADRELTLWAPDLALHYRHGQDADVAVCYGLSGFSVQQDVDRQMTFFRLGYGKSATGLATTKAQTVYVDAFFQYIESDVSELHLLVAQPIGASAVTKGWQ